MTMTPRPLGPHAGARFRPPEHFGFAAQLAWIPVNDTEYQLVSHHLPLAVRTLGGMPRLGALAHPAFLARAAVDEAGRWVAGYRPLALRTYPFVLASARAGARPVDELDFVEEAGLVGEWGMPVAADPAAGTLSPELGAVRNTLHMMRAGAVRLSVALDLLRISDVLVPLRDPAGAAASDQTVDAERLAAMGPEAAAALCGRSFLPLDLAVAIAFSRRHLHPDRLPAPVRGAAAGGGEPARPAEQASLLFAGLEGLDFALDGSELFDPAAVRNLADFAAPPPPAEPAAPAASAA